MVGRSPRQFSTTERTAANAAFFVQWTFFCVSDVPAIADYPLDDKGTTYRKLILDKYPELDINFVHHAGNSSGVVDGSAAILLASPSYAKAHGLKPRARVVAMANMGDSPTLMLNAPVPAARKVLAKAGLTLDDIDLLTRRLRSSPKSSSATQVRPREGQRQWRLDRARPSHRCNRLDPDWNCARRAGAAQPQAGFGDDVRRRRHGVGDRARLTEGCPLNSMKGGHVNSANGRGWESTPSGSRAHLPARTASGCGNVGPELRSGSQIGPAAERITWR
jgi:hypothetical protein